MVINSSMASFTTRVSSRNNLLLSHVDVLVIPATMLNIVLTLILGVSSSSLSMVMAGVMESVVVKVDTMVNEADNSSKSVLDNPF